MKKISIIYWSGTGNTEAMAKLIAEGAKESGAEVVVKSVSEASVTDVQNSDVIALGCPAMGESIKTTDMETFVSSTQKAIKGKKIALFGSYDWGTGEWILDWRSRMVSYGANLINYGLNICGAPEGVTADECTKLGKQLAR
ncbi:MAG: flavodoxin [Clostridioides sp.]|jgi:flavodoxin short chain|nr:flavodoxin [Clostridioides sp.]